MMYSKDKKTREQPDSYAGKNRNNPISNSTGGNKTGNNESQLRAYKGQNIKAEKEKENEKENKPRPDKKGPVGTGNNRQTGNYQKKTGKKRPYGGKRKKRINKRKLKRLNRLKRIQLAKVVIICSKNRNTPLTKMTIDYKNVPLLKRYITFEGKITTRRYNFLTAKKQRKMTNAIKTARVAGLLPFLRH